MKTISMDESYFEGAVSVEQTGNGLKPWRVDYRLRDLFPSLNHDMLLQKMECGSGVRLRIFTNSRMIRLKVHPRNEQRTFDLTLDNELVHSIILDPDKTDVLFEQLPVGEKVVEIWLPQKSPTEIAGLYIDDDCVVSVHPDNRLKWVAYGSSITHCGEAHSPSRIWPAIASRAHNLNLTALGYGGNCHLEPMVARMIRDREADLITLKLGINVYGAGSLSPRTFKAAVIGMVQIIREKHPEVPIGVISPIVSPDREEQKNAVGFTLAEMRDEMRDAVNRMRQVTLDKKLFYFDGLSIFGHEMVGPRLPDNLHPDGDGYEVLGRNVAEQVLPVLLKHLDPGVKG